MLNVYTVISLLIAFAFVVLGVTALTRNIKSTIHKYFCVYSFTLAIWLISNYLGGDPEVSLTIAYWANKLVFISGGLSVLFLLFFVKTLTQRSYTNFEKIIVGINPVLIAASATPLVITGVYPQADTYAIDFGALSGLYFAIVIATVVASVYNLFAAHKHSVGILRSQIDVILYSFAAGASVIVTTSVILPFTLDYYGLTQVGSFFSVFFVVGLAYAIVKHKLFDIRLVVARSLGYVLSIVSLGWLYGLTAYLLFPRIFFPDLDLTLIQEIFFAITAVMIAVTFQPLKTLFDRITNRLFYRDAYDAQDFLDKLNRVLVTKVDVELLLEETVSVIKSNLKSNFAAFSLRKTQYLESRLIGDTENNLTEEDINKLGKYISRIHTSVIVTDELAPDDAELMELLRKYDISVIARLVTNIEFDVEGVGYLMLGPKNSGGQYVQQDVKILEIIANELVIAIQNALRFEEIEEFNVTLQQKVDDATKKLRHTNEKLRQMDETKDEFISMASHQLRTPLTSVKGYLSMVLEGDAGDIKPMQERLLTQAFTSSQRMVYLIADLLNVSRLRTGKFVIEPIKSNLAEVIQGEVQQLHETAASRKVKLLYKKPDAFPSLMLDETKVRQVVMNFIDNAIYYTPGGGTITVELEDKPDSVEYTVNDTGMGVPKSDQQHLFEKFYRAENARRARPDGTGLGLFMSKKVIVAQGGAIIFKSEEGKGSTFGFSLPKAKLLPQEVSTEVKD